MLKHQSIISIRKVNNDGGEAEAFSKYKINDKGITFGFSLRVVIAGS